MKAKIPSETDLKHDKSVVAYPNLDLSDDEYVVIDVDRSKVGLAYIWLVIVVLSALFVGSAYFAVPFLGEGSRLLIVLAGYFMVLLVCLGGTVASSIYRNNSLTVSNKRFFFRMQRAPFAYHNQIVELENVSEISYWQGGILSTLFNYGVIRLSTVADEHTYKFTMVSGPASQVKDIKRVVQEVTPSLPKIPRNRPLYRGRQ